MNLSGTITSSELLMPRYKCMADYPGSFIKKGEIAQTHELASAYSVEVNGNIVISEKVSLGDYPAIFQRLEWWQERNPDSLPDYVKDESGQVWKVGEYTFMAGVIQPLVLLCKRQASLDRPYSSNTLFELLPSTEGEYYQYLQPRF